MPDPKITEKPKIYEKYHSFESFVSNIASDQDEQRRRAIVALKNFNSESGSAKDVEIVSAALKDLTSDDPQVHFKITAHISDELSRLEDEHVLRYLTHRYRYDVYPRLRKLGEYPPYLQIEPTSICNYRCVFCYQSDKNFASKGSGHMGSMSLDTFKNIIDQSLGNIEFFSLASRGEPLICKDIDKMLYYTSGKFLGLKINTNASLLNEKHAHAILAGGISTVVFSADAAEEPLYSQLRIGGRLETVLRNIELFNTIKAKHYSQSRIITRVSGVKLQEGQKMDAMKSTWGGLVDQLSFVKYNPWENVYKSELTNINEPCSDLWRRMFIWYDGKINPCDTDYKSILATGHVEQESISQAWHSERYNRLRDQHLQKQRLNVEPCRRCVVT